MQWRRVARHVLLAIDDTDSPEGGCTTHTLFHALLAVPELAPRSLPRLVRLNPNVPWKTRGNGAVAVSLGVPRGPQARIGELRGREILVFPEAPPAAPTPELLDAVWEAVRRAAQPDSEPAVALLPGSAPSWWYHAAVQTIVEPADAEAALAAEGALFEAAGSQRGLVGCLAAAAWPGPPASYEMLAYRAPDRWGTPRAVQPGPLAALDAWGATFHTIDPDVDRLCCVPATPDPVLCGLRGRDPDRLRDAAIAALARAAGEPIDAWLLWASNQASGDHVVAVTSLLDAPEAATVHASATVAGLPDTREGGHVFVAMEDASGIAFDAAAFEPTGRFRDIVRGLRPGDAVEVVGAWASGVVRLEKLHLVAAAEHPLKLANPSCEACVRSMKSRGAGAGYRCPSCGATAPEAAATHEPEQRLVAPGWHEVPVRARRHLHRPTTWPPRG